MDVKNVLTEYPNDMTKHLASFIIASYASKISKPVIDNCYYLLALFWVKLYYATDSLHDSLGFTQAEWMYAGFNKKQPF